MNKLILAIVAILLNIALIGWLIHSNTKKQVIIAIQEINIENAKLQIANAKRLYDAKVIEIDLNKATMKRIENEIKNIKTKLNTFKPGTTGGLEL